MSSGTVTGRSGPHPANFTEIERGSMSEIERLSDIADEIVREHRSQRATPGYEAGIEAFIVAALEKERDRARGQAEHAVSGASNWFPADEDDLLRWGLLYAQRLKDRLEQWLVPMVDPDAPALKLARLYWVVRKLDDEFGAAVKILEAQKGRLSGEILHAAYERDKAGKTLTARFDEQDYRITLSTALRASIRKGCKDGAYEWLRDNKLGDLIVETVNAQTLGAAATHMMTENRELPEELFNAYYQNTVSVTQVKS